MSTPWIIAKEEKDGTINAIACRYDGYLQDQRNLVKNLSAEDTERLLALPYNEISRIYNKTESEEIARKLNYSPADIVELSPSRFAHLYREEQLKTFHNTKNHTQYANRIELIENAGYLENWNILFLLGSDNIWYYRKWNGKAFRTL